MNKPICACCNEECSVTMNVPDIGNVCPECYTNLVITNNRLNFFEKHGKMPELTENPHYNEQDNEL
jgi:hypothetical protein